MWAQDSGWVLSLPLSACLPWPPPVFRVQGQSPTRGWQNHTSLWCASWLSPSGVEEAQSGLSTRAGWDGQGSPRLTEEQQFGLLLCVMLFKGILGGFNLGDRRAPALPSCVAVLVGALRCLPHMSSSLSTCPLRRFTSLAVTLACLLLARHCGHCCTVSFFYNIQLQHFYYYNKKLSLQIQ